MSKDKGVLTFRVEMTDGTEEIYLAWNWVLEDGCLVFQNRRGASKFLIAAHAWRRLNEVEAT